MENLYTPLRSPNSGSCGLRLLRSVMTTLSLLFCVLLFESATGQVVMPSSGFNQSGQVDSSVPDRVPASRYQMLNDAERTSVPNPDLPPSITCPNLKVIFVLDESGSLTSSADKAAVRAGAYALANALAGTGAELRVIEFATNASLVSLGGTVVNNTFLTNFNNYLYSSYSGQSYNPVSASPCTGWTNWEAALDIAEDQIGSLVIFFTDGNPTAYNVSNNGNCSGGSVNAGSESSIVSTALSKAITKANNIKTLGKHMFVLGLGSDINVSNMIAISDNDNFSTTNNIFTADYSVGNISDLTTSLQAAVNVICGTTISITKVASSSKICLGEYVTFTITVQNTGSPNGYSALGTVLTDVFPSGYSNLQFVGSAPSGATISGNTLTYNIGTLTNGQSKTIQVKAKANNTSNVLNTAIATANNANQVTASASPNFETTPPTIDCPPNVTVNLNKNCYANTNPSNTGSAKGKDNCSQGVTITYSDDVVTGCGSSKVITRTWVATDALGNTTSCQQIINVVDTTNPTITAPSNVTVTCASDVPAANTSAVTASDNCSGVQVVFVSDDIENYECVNKYKIKRKYKAIDACGNYAIATQTITVNDNVAPVINNIPNLSVNCTETLPAPDPSSVVATDNCGGNVTITHVSDTPSGSGCNYSITRKYKATDACGNIAYKTQTINVTDNTNPTASDPADIIIPGCNVALPTPDPSVVLDEADNCSTPTVTFHHDDEPVVTGCTTTVKRWYKVKDACGNHIYVKHNIVRTVDTVNPTITTQGNFTLPNCNQDWPTNVTASWTDNCSAGGVVTGVAGDVTTNGCNQSRTYTFNVTDACGNSATASVVVSRTYDVTAPVIAAPADYVLPGCNPEWPASIEAAWTDNCSAGGIVIGVADSTITDECAQSRTYLFIITDDCGNSSYATTTITRFFNEAAPVIIPVADYTLPGCNQEWPVLTTQWTSNCSGGGNVTGVAGEVVTNGCTQTRVYTFTVNDDCGLPATASTTVTRTYDVTAPVIAAPADFALELCNQEWPASIEAAWTDNCSAGGIVIGVAGDVTTDGCSQSRTYTFNVTDACGNNSTASVVVSRTYDSEEPVLLNCPEDVVLECNEDVPTPAVVTATDNCMGEIEPIFEEFIFGHEPTPGAISDCKLITPTRPANNPCGYPVDWAMALFGLPKAHRYYHVENGYMATFPDGSIHLTAEMHNAYNNANGWNVDVWFNNEQDWNEFSNQAFPTNFKADCGAVGANHQDWLYYVLQASAGAELTGFGGYAGSTLNLVHAPANKYFGFQLGDGANNYNAAENGFGGWFSYSGTFMVNNQPYGATGTISGGGDFAFELDCCPDYYIIRQWTVTDCAGNTNSCSQTISFAKSQIGGGDLVTLPNEEAQDGNMVISVAPNPTNSNTMFVFKTKENAPTTLEVFDAIGQKVADVFMGTIEAGTEYKVNYNVNALATGIYLYRLQNGNSVEVGKLIIGR